MLEFLSFLAPPTAIPGLEWRILAVLAFTGAAAYYDAFNKKWVPNWLAYSFLACAFLLNLIFFDQAIFLQAIAIGAVVFAVSFVLYKFGQLGGADAYVLASIALAVPYLPKPLLVPAQAVPYPFILSILIPTGIAFILHMLARFIPYISREISSGRVKFTVARLLGPALLAAALVVFTSALLTLPVAVPSAYLAIILFLSLALLFFSLFKDEIKHSMVSQVATSRLLEEDVLALEMMPPETVKKLRLYPLMDAKIISLLKKSKLKKVPVYTGMPFFLPYLFFGLLFTVLFGDLLFYLL